MKANETKLEMVRRDVQEGAALVARQRLLVDRLRAGGLLADEAEAVLATYETLQRQHEGELAEIRLEFTREAQRPPNKPAS